MSPMTKSEQERVYSGCKERERSYQNLQQAEEGLYELYGLVSEAEGGLYQQVERKRG
jgi:hypothetical protein